MFSYILGIFFITVGLLFLLYPEGLRRRLRKKALRRIRRYFFAGAVFLGILLISTGWNHDGLLPKILTIGGIIAVLKGLFFLKSKAADKVTAWILEQPVFFFKKAICATVLAISSEQSQRGKTPHKMAFDDPAFDFIPWAKPLSDPRKTKITVKQLLNHTSGICPEATGARNKGTWQYILGHSGDERTAKLAFDPGTACGYSTHALAHAALVCEYVTGRPYDKFAVEALFKPIGCEHWWFQYFDGGEEIGRHPSHGMGMPVRDLARIAYCMLRNGKWKNKQVIPKWFVEQTAAPTHDVRTPEMRWNLNPGTFSHGWELPANLTGDNTEGRTGAGIPQDARYKPGSGGQLIAFVPSLDLVITRQTGSSGNWQFAEYLRRACVAVLTD